MERYVGKHQKEPGHQTRDTASPVDNVRSPGSGGGSSLLIWPRLRWGGLRHAGVLRDICGGWADRWLCRVFVLVRWGGMERRVELFAAIRFAPGT